MSDPLSVAGSIAGILSLSVGVFHKLVRFGKEVKGAQSKVEQLASECRNLSGVLQNLTLLASSLDSELTGPTNNKAHYLHDCRNTLFKLESHLKKARNDFDGESRIKATVRRLKWPFSTPETTDLINDIRRHRETLEFALSADTLTALLDCLKRQDALRSGVDELRDTIERRFQIETRVELVKKREEVIKFFMGSVNPQASLQDCLELRSPMTGLWLTESDPTFVQWRHEPGSKLWLSGIPGAGKTVLCGAVIEEILQDSSNTVAVSFFFCAYKSADTQDPVKLLSAIATQLALQSSEAFGKLEDYYNKLNPRDHLQSQPRLPKLRKLIHNMTTCFGRVYVVIDGIDECGQNVSKIAQAAKDLSTDSLNLNIAIFSRDEHEIREELEDGFEHVEIAAHTEDLDIYVQAEMSTRKRLLHLSLRNPGLHEEIRSTLIKGAHGM
ncbi:hypothetical protein F4780DRAFT_770919 [Xylariomycetidae sp. FL0641]|nr:hypothetical protein F4780DRAFT_770919 [Xylariomycetidae sp. FL0641]